MRSIKHLDRTLILGPYSSLCVEEKAFIKECKRIGIEASLIPPWIGAGGHATTHHFANVKIKGDYFIVCIRPNKEHTREQCYSLLAHEAVHVFEGWMKEIGEAHPGEEIKAYGIQNITQSLLEAYRDMKR